MILDTINKSLRFVLGEPKSTTDCDVIACFADTTDSGFAPTSVNTITNGTTPVTAVAAPGADVQRQVNEVRLFNNDSITHTVTLQLDNNGTIAVIGEASVPAGASVLYTPEATIGAGAATSEWNAGTVDFLSPNLTIRTGASLDLANSISIVGTVTAAAATFSGLMNAGSIELGGTTVSAFGPGVTVSGGTLDGLWQAGTVTAVGPGVTLSSGTLDGLWQAGTVTTVGTNLALGSGTLSLGTIAATSLFGNPAASAGPLSAVAIGSGLSLSVAGTLSASGSGGTVTQVNTSGAGISGGPITGTGTLTVEWNAGTVAALDPTQLQLNGGGTLQFITGPTILAGQTSAPLIVNRLTSAATVVTPQAAVVVSGGTTAGVLGTAIEINSYGGTAINYLTRANGTPTAPTALSAGNVIGAMNVDGYNGTAYTGFTGTPGFRIQALNNWTTADTSSFMTWLNIRSATTVQVEDMRLTGGALLVGTTVAVGSEKLNVNGGFVMGGTAGAGAAGTIQVTGSTAPMVVNANTNTAHLSTTNGTDFLVVGVDGGNATGEIQSIAGTVTGNSGAAQIVMGRNNGSIASGTSLNANDRIAVFGLRGHNGTVYANSAGFFAAFAAANWSGTSQPFYQTWQVIPVGTTVAVEKMRLFSTGNLALGTTTDNGVDTLQVNGSSTQTQVARTTTNAAAGYVGEYVSSVVPIGSAITLSPTIVAAVGTITLTAGDWDINGAVYLTGDPATVISTAEASINTLATTRNTAPGMFYANNFGTVALSTFLSSPSLNVIGTRVTAASNYYINVDIGFAGGTLLAAYGILQARRR